MVACLFACLFVCYCVFALLSVRFRFKLVGWLEVLVGTLVVLLFFG